VPRGNGLTDATPRAKRAETGGPAVSAAAIRAAIHCARHATSACPKAHRHSIARWPFRVRRRVAQSHPSRTRAVTRPFVSAHLVRPLSRSPFDGGCSLYTHVNRSTSTRSPSPAAGPTRALAANASAASMRQATTTRLIHVRRPKPGLRRRTSIRSLNPPRSSDSTCRGRPYVSERSSARSRR
jgi:hypothetical protein